MRRKRKPTFTTQEITYVFLAAATVDLDLFDDPAIKAALCKVRAYAIVTDTSVEFPDWVVV